MARAGRRLSIAGGSAVNVLNLLGQISREYLGAVVDSKHRQLIPNPEHGDQQMSEEC